jgi:hypothetical protein
MLFEISEKFRRQSVERAAPFASEYAEGLFLDLLDQASRRPLRSSHQRLPGRQPPETAIGLMLEPSRCHGLNALATRIKNGLSSG